MEFLYSFNDYDHSPRFSPPQTSICVSYFPSLSKYGLLMTNSPPAIMGVRIACVGSFCLDCLSTWLRYSHLKTRLQSNPPLRSADAPVVRNGITSIFDKRYCNVAIYCRSISILKIRWLSTDVLKGVHADDIDDRTHDP